MRSRKFWADAIFWTLVIGAAIFIAWVFWSEINAE